MILQKLWPINRSITGDGVRETLSLISHQIKNLEIKSVPSNTSVFDWTVPREWRVKEAYIIDPKGKKFVTSSLITFIWLATVFLIKEK